MEQAPRVQHRHQWTIWLTNISVGRFSVCLFHWASHLLKSTYWHTSGCTKISKAFSLNHFISSKNYKLIINNKVTNFLFWCEKIAKWLNSAKMMLNRPFSYLCDVFVPKNQWFSDCPFFLVILWILFIFVTKLSSLIGT